MSRETVLRYAEAWQAGDVGTMLGLYAEDFVLHYFGDSPLAGEHIGQAAALEALLAASARTNRTLVAVDDVLSGDVLHAIVARERVGADQREVRRVLLYRADEHHLTECWLFDEDQRAIDALWSVTG
ncbi:unnamed protein product [Phaeothamnion confervicola]